MSSDEHEPVLLSETVEALAVEPDGTYLDCTFGRGGHSRALLSRLGAGGRIIALDRDPAAIEFAVRIEDPRLKVVHAAFSELTSVLEAQGVGFVHGALFDIGVSSPQLADAARGMSFRLEGPLDMRMDTTRGMTAAQWLSQVSEHQLQGVIKEYGEERFARKIARAIVAARSRAPLDSSRELAKIVASAVPTREPGQDPATRTFQALRIFINKELEELQSGLGQALGKLMPGARMAVISFHSLEDRIVKHFFQHHSRSQGVPDRLPLRAQEMPKPLLRIVGKAIRASHSEVRRNPRSRSAVLRVAERLAA